MILIPAIQKCILQKNSDFLTEFVSSISISVSPGSYLHKRVHFFLSWSYSIKPLTDFFFLNKQKEWKDIISVHKNLFIPATTLWGENWTIVLFENISIESYNSLSGLEGNMENSYIKNCRCQAFWKLFDKGHGFFQKSNVLFWLDCNGV